MKAYIMTIVAAALLSVFSDLILPTAWRKYVRMLTGLIIISTIIAPVAKFKNVDFFQEFQMEETTITEAQTATGEEIVRELEFRIAKDAAERILKEFGVATQVRATVKTDAENRIEYVSTLEITAKNLPPEAKARMQEIYDVREVIIHD